MQLVHLHTYYNKVRNKTIIGLKSRYGTQKSKTKPVRNKTIIGLKYRA